MATMTAPAMTDEQKAGHTKLLAYITGEDKTFQMYDLIGYAGTGKTFTLAQVVSTLRVLNNEGPMFGGGSYRVAMSAPTHKAVRVMRKFSRNMHGVTFATIHSLLGLKAEVDAHGKQAFKQSKDLDQVRIEQFNVLFIDEVSMLADELFDLLVPYVKRGLKLIFIGDPKQIPPVNHLDAKPLMKPHQDFYKIGVASLETIMRQAMDNPILALATRIRKAEANTPRFEVVTHLTEEGKGIIALESQQEMEIRQIIDEKFNCEEFRQDADHMKIICYRNDTVNAFNKIVRGYLYQNCPQPLPFIMVGEKLIVDKPVVLPNNKTLLTTNEEIEIDRFDIKEMEIEYLTAEQVDRRWAGIMKRELMRCYNTWVKYYDEEGIQKECNIRILHEDDQPKMAAIIKKIADTAKLVTYTDPLRIKLWRGFYAMEGLFAQVKYNYAITAHKSQGSTYDNCMVVDWDIATNRRIAERNRILYVAVTRARNLLYFVK